MARPLSPFPESFLRTLPCNRPNSLAHWRRWTRISSSSTDLRFAQGIVVSVPFLKRGERIFAPLLHSSPDIARNCGCLRTALPKSFLFRSRFVGLFSEIKCVVWIDESLVTTSRRLLMVGNRVDRLIQVFL